MVQATPHTIGSWQAESAADLEHFRGIPWAAKIIDTPGIRPYTTTMPFPGGCDPMARGILAGRDGVRHHVSLLADPGVLRALDDDDEDDGGGVGGGVRRSRRSKAVGEGEDSDVTKRRIPRGQDLQRQSQSPSPSSPTTSSTTTSPSTTTSTTRIKSTTAPTPADHNKSKSDKKDRNPFPVHLDLYTLGPALHGIPRTLHGGLVALLIDATCGRVGFMHRDLSGQSYSAYTNVRFLKPMIYNNGNDECGSSSSGVGIGGNSGDEDGTITILLRSQIRREALARPENNGHVDGGGDSSGKRKGAKKMPIIVHVERGDGDVYTVGESMVVEKVWTKAKLS